MPRKRRKSPAQPHWRPNFRNPETLPDIKVVRTHFLLNAVTLSLAVLFLGLLAYREYRIASIAEAIEDLEENIADTRATDRANVRLSGTFGKARQAVAEFVDFHNVPAEAAELCHAIAGLQPPEVILDSISFTPGITRQGRRETVRYQLVLNGTVTDSESRSATDIITDYRNAYRELELIEPYFESSDLSGFSRNDPLGLFNFTVRVTLSLEPKEAS